jgi:multicomponent Na+:H+ antiporter subunit D
MRQRHLKARLAWSTISQLSYIVLGAALLTPLAALAAVVHVAHQAVAKITMFFAVGAIRRTTGVEYVDDLAGMATRMPWTMAAFAVGSLSFVGVPLFAGFVTKWYLSLGAIAVGAWWAVGVMLLSSLLNAAYWFEILHLAYFRPPPDEAPPRRRPEAPWTLLVPMLVSALYVVLLGVSADVPGMPFSIAEVAVDAMFGGGPGGAP